MHMLKRIIASFFTLIFLLQGTSIAVAQMPPTSAPKVDGYVPVISDYDMQQCTKLYQKSERVYKELLAMPIDPQDPKSVRKVRNKYQLHERMVKQFNNICAGKQSLSSCKDTRQKRLEQGLSYQDCRVSKAR